jgi:hypothetical protein
MHNSIYTLCLGVWKYTHINVNYIKLAIDIGCDIMGRLDIVIPDELENELRMEIIKRFGGRKGDLSKALTEAIQQWITIPTEEDLKKITDEVRNMKPENRKKFLESLS